MILVTGGCGFIGSNFILNEIDAREQIVNLDVLSYAGNLSNLETVAENSNYKFIHGSICDENEVGQILQNHKPTAIVNFAAESHVDRSISSPRDFVETNILGTFVLLEEARKYWSGLNPIQKSSFRFIHVSTDEVYGSLDTDDPPFRETTKYAPNSPYSASKAASDHLVRSYFHTYGLPAIITNCSNNYGPRQFPEKLIPLVLLNALSEKPLPIYGDGQQVRDWLYVDDHCSAIKRVLISGKIGEVYNIGGNNELTNKSVVLHICELLNELRPRSIGKYQDLITYVADRPGHDRRYAIDSGKINRDLDWRPKENFGSGLKKTVHWFLENSTWIDNVTSGAYRQWVEEHYG